MQARCNYDPYFSTQKSRHNQYRHGDMKTWFFQASCCSHPRQPEGWKYDGVSQELLIATPMMP